MTAISIDTDPAFHTQPTEDHPVVVYGNINNMACSACAPRDMADVQVANAVAILAPPHLPHVAWQCIDVASVRRGPSSPSLCPHYPDRLHWWLIGVEPKRERRNGLVQSDFADRIHRSWR